MSICFSCVSTQHNMPIALEMVAAREQHEKKVEQRNNELSSLAFIARDKAYGVSRDDQSVKKRRQFQHAHIKIYLHWSKNSHEEP